MKHVPTGRWKQIDAIVDGALDLPEEERAAFIAQQCGDDEKLRGEVMAMMGAGAVAGDFLENQGPEFLGEMRSAVRKAADQEEDSLIGAHVGPYKLLRPIGKGGMGHVYLAMRDDASYTRYVAVKVIRRGMDTDEILRRFKMERRILASLAHPNIARLLDGGATEDGLSYFVMEYIEGEPITEYCDARKMAVRQRLELFAQVCAAVQFAHRNLIVHRDLKPSNILVTADGTPKLLDFGIAKVLNPDLAGYSMPMTQADVRVMTPEYASPEQMRGGTVTTASDVYQLGVLLYELLTGSRPHRTEGRSRREIEEMVISTEPERPSTAVSQVSPDTLSKRIQRDGGPQAAQTLKKTLSGDLDRIALMALRKEPDRRYPSADLFKEDIRRYLDGMPVSAQADTLTYRASKFVRRHKIGVAASAGLAILLVAVTVLAIRFALVTNEQSERIALAAAKTEQVSRFLVSTFQWAHPDVARGREVTVHELVDRAVEQIDQELAGQPDLQSHMLMELGVAYREMGDLEASGQLLQRALAMRRADVNTPPLDVAASLFHLGVQREWVGEWDDAEDLLSEALEIRRTELGPADPVVAQSMNSLAAILSYTGHADRSEQMLREALDILRETKGEDSREFAEVQSSLGWVVHDIGLANEDPELLKEAEIMYQASLERQLELLGEEHPNIASMYTNLGSMMQDTGQYEEAEELHRRGLAIKRRVYGDAHPLVANSISHVARALFALGEMAEAEPLFRDVLARHIEQLGPDHPYVGRDHANLGAFLVAKGEHAEAESQLVRALDVYRSNDFPRDHTWVEQARASLTTVYDATGAADRSALY